MIDNALGPCCYFDRAFLFVLGEGHKMMRPFVSSLLSLTVVGFTVAQAADGIKAIGSCQTIDSPGSYLVTKDLQAAGDCIVVNASFVTLDLGGHTIVGNGTGNGITGPFVSPAPRSIAIRNGSITGFNDGILLYHDGITIEGIRAVGNSNVGIITTGFGAVKIMDSSVDHNTYGISCNQQLCSVIGNTATGNSTGGILMLCPGTAINNAAWENGGNGPISNIFTDGACTRVGNFPAP